MVNLTELIQGELCGGSLIIWTIVYLTSAICGFVSNLIIIWIVCTDRDMRTTTNIYIANLAIADGLVTTVSAPLVTFRLNYGDWPLGYKLCKFNEFFGALTVCVSLISLLMIALDQYNGIRDPFRIPVSNYKSVLLICLMWLTGGLITVPHWLPVETYKYITLDRKEVSVCIRKWEDYNLHFWYRVSSMIFAYFLPLISISYCYCRIGAQMWLNTNQWTNKSESKINQNHNVKKIVIGMLLIVIGFAVSWLPAHILLILTARDENFPIGYEFGLTVALALVIGHSMYNPVIYFCISSRWRAAFRKAFKSC